MYPSEREVELLAYLTMQSGGAEVTLSHVNGKEETFKPPVVFGCWTVLAARFAKRWAFPFQVLSLMNLGSFMT